MALFFYKILIEESYDILFSFSYDMNISVISNIYAGMAKDDAHVLDVCSFLEESGCKSMSECVWCYTVDSAPFGGSL